MYGALVVVNSSTKHQSNRSAFTRLKIGVGQKFLKRYPQVFGTAMRRWCRSLMRRRAFDQSSATMRPTRASSLEHCMAD
jgi:hypothetical protein